MSIQSFYNRSKNIFKDPKGYENELLSICCVVKTMMGWNCERVVSVCRERCGGMGYLAVNKFAAYLACAHASITAEGDNRVLMVKVCKDLMTNVARNGFKFPATKLNVTAQIGTFMDVTQLDTLVDLLRFREKALFAKLVTRMGDYEKAGKSKY
jgi:acyl-CoA oxidase